MVAVQAADKDGNLPLLREDLQLLKGTPTLSGTPTWMVFDPVQHRYYKIDHAAFELLSIWNAYPNRDRLIQAANERFTSEFEPEKIEEILSFCDTQNLLVEPAGADWRKFSQAALRKKRQWWRDAMHSYLFMRVPLLRPDAFLQKTYPLVRPLFSKAFLIVIVTITLAGLYLVSREWDAFVATFPHFFSWQGAAMFAVSLAGLKVLHEFGHAYAATRAGCRVPTMGVAFLVMVPVLYTDVSDAWRLRSKSERLVIGAAGMMVELCIAGIASFMWVFLDDGLLRSIAFVLATVSWIMSLAINLNPLLRFDGYYLLADALGIENLQARSFALGRWALRRILFGLKDPEPETLPRSRRNLLIAYAWATWVYRLLLFIAIALVVYFFFFKVLGVILFAVEIVWFILRPIWSELREWKSNLPRIVGNGRAWMTVAIACVALVLAFAPVSRGVAVPAILEPAQFSRLYANSKAQVVAVAVKNGQHVKAGNVLLELRSPSLQHELKLARIELDLVERRLARVAGDVKDRSELIVLRRQQAALRDKIAGVQKEIGLLTVRAPFAGTVQDVNSGLHFGRWVDRREPLAVVIGPGGDTARGYIQEADLWRVRQGDRGKFIADDGQFRNVAVSVQDISASSVSELPLAYLASTYDGPIAVRKDDKDRLIPVSAQYPVRLHINSEGHYSNRVVRGVVHVQGQAESMASRLWRKIVRVLVRESGA